MCEWMEKINRFSTTGRKLKSFLHIFRLSVLLLTACHCGESTRVEERVSRQDNQQ